MHDNRADGLEHYTEAIMLSRFCRVVERPLWLLRGHSGSEGHVRVLEACLCSRALTSGCTRRSGRLLSLGIENPDYCKSSVV